MQEDADAVEKKKAGAVGGLGLSRLCTALIAHFIQSERLKGGRRKEGDKQFVSSMFASVLVMKNC